MNISFQFANNLASFGKYVPGIPDLTCVFVRSFIRLIDLYLPDQKEKHSVKNQFSKFLPQKELLLENFNLQISKI